SRDVLRGSQKVNTERLNQAGIKTHFSISPLTAHEWQTWRRSLHAFAPLIFK
ncbi:esterase, partial [Flavobacterium bomense]